MTPQFGNQRQQWSLFNHFRTAQRHCGACKKKWNQAATDLCPCGEKQTMSHIVDSSSVEVKWWLFATTLRWRWSCCLADQLWLFHKKKTAHLTLIAKLHRTKLGTHDRILAVLNKQNIHNSLQHGCLHFTTDTQPATWNQKKTKTLSVTCRSAVPSYCTPDTNVPITETKHTAPHLTSQTVYSTSASRLCQITMHRYIKPMTDTYMPMLTAISTVTALNRCSNVTTVLNPFTSAMSGDNIILTHFY